MLSPTALCYPGAHAPYNNRENPYLFRGTLLRLIGAESVPYETLIGN